MTRDMIARRLHHPLGPFRNVAVAKLRHIPTGFADDMVVMMLQQTKLILYFGTARNPEDDSERFEKVERSIDRGESDLPISSQKTLIKLSGASGMKGGSKFLEDKEPRMAPPEPVVS